jgi:dihydropyrimidinase
MTSEFDLVIRGGTVVTASDTMLCDVGVRDGKIVALAANLPPGARDVDATGLLVLPGGIDSHVHIDQPNGPETVQADTFESGTLSAAFGGNTTVLPFALQQKGQSLRDAVRDYHAKADGECYVDYGFHLIVSDPTEQLLGQDLPALVQDGYTSFKVFMTYEDLRLDDRQILDVMSVAREQGALVMVHAENFDAIRFLTQKLENEGKTAPLYHGASRPAVVEREATHRAISLAELVDVPIMIVHVSGRESMEQIRWAQARGLKIYGETCPQYLVLTEADMDGADMEGAKFVCSPPPRDVASQEACWEGLETGVFQVFSSDHCPFRFREATGKMHPKARSSFRWVPNGIPGIETRLPILFSEGVTKGRISINRFVALTATNHARMYGLYPRKGTIAIGSDADIVLWDAARQVTLSQSLLHHGADYTPYEGFDVTGWPVTTILRGTIVVENGMLCGAKGGGTFLSRDLPEQAKPRAPAVF